MNKVSNAQKCLDTLCDELLGKDYYIASSMGQNQANEFIVEDILYKYRPRKSLKQIIKNLVEKW